MATPGELLHMMESLERENEQLKVQAAAMIAALQPCASGDEWKDTEALINSMYTPVAFARQVCAELLDEFSAVPKAAWTGEVKVGPGGVVLYQLNAPFARAWDGRQYNRDEGKVATAVVLVKQEDQK